MKKTTLLAAAVAALIATSNANAEVVIGISGNWAQASIGDETLDDVNLTCDSSYCDGGDDFGLGFHVQFLTPTKAGNSAGIHISRASYSFEGNIKNTSDDLEYDADIFDVLGVVKWKSDNNTPFFLMAGYSAYDASSNNSGFEKDGSGIKVVAGWDLESKDLENNFLVTPAISVAKYGDDIINTVLRLGIGYKF